MQRLQIDCRRGRLSLVAPEDSGRPVEQLTAPLRDLVRMDGGGGGGGALSQEKGGGVCGEDGRSLELRLFEVDPVGGTRGRGN